MPSRVTAFLRDERGATTIEYALLVCLLALVIVASIRQIGVNIGTMFAKPLSQALT